MKLNALYNFRLLAGNAILGLLLTIPSAGAEETNTLEIIKQLQQRIDQLETKVRQLESEKQNSGQATDEKGRRLEELDQKVKVLERQKEVEQEVADAKAKEMPRITIGSEGFGFSSADGKFGVQLRGVLQVDSRTFFGDSGISGNDGFLLRRARPILQGTLWRDFDFLFVPDFAGTGSPQILDAYINYRYRPELQLRVGKFKAPIGLEQLMVDAETLFNERALATDLVPNRDLGADLHGDLFQGLVTYDVGIFNGVGDNRNSSNADLDDNKAFAGRIFFEPFKKLSRGLQGLGFGVGGSYEATGSPNIAGLPATTGGTLAGFSTDGQQQFFAYNPASNAVVVANGEHWRLSPQGYYYYGPFGLFGEYVISEQRVSRTLVAPLTSASLDNRAWEITGCWILTREDAAYKGGIVPRKPFNPLEGHWGALQLVARYAQLNVDEDAFPLFSNPATSARSADSWAVGLNWYLNKNVLVKTSFSHTAFTGGGGSGLVPPAAVTRKDENVFFTRMQLAF